MIDSTLDLDPIMRTVGNRLTPMGRPGRPGWFAGARLTFAEPDLRAAGLPHPTTAEILALALADSSQHAAGPVGEFVHSTGRSARLLKGGIAALRQTAMPLGGSVHPGRGHAVSIEEPLTTRAESEDELLWHTVCHAAEGELQETAVRQGEGARYVAEVSSEVTHGNASILVWGVAGPGPCGWCAHRTLERVVGSSTPFPTGWPRSAPTNPNYDELVMLGRIERRHVFMTAYQREVNLTSATGLVQLLLGS
jgi:hypothetical protein